MGKAMHHSGVEQCMLLVGVLRPHTGSMRGAHHHQLRGILCHAEKLAMRADEGTAAFPSDALEHGWYACLSRDAATLVFARNGQDASGPLLPAVLPSLAALGLRVWRRGNTSFVVAKKGQPPPTGEEWEQRLRESVARATDQHGRL